VFNFVLHFICGAGVGCLSRSFNFGVGGSRKCVTGDRKWEARRGREVRELWVGADLAIRVAYLGTIYLPPLSYNIS
jgi:hypothetical protein